MPARRPRLDNAAHPPAIRKSRHPPFSQRVTCFCSAYSFYAFFLDRTLSAIQYTAMHTHVTPRIDSSHTEDSGRGPRLFSLPDACGS